MLPHGRPDKPPHGHRISRKEKKRHRHSHSCQGRCLQRGRAGGTARGTARRWPSPCPARPRLPPLPAPAGARGSGPFAQSWDGIKAGGTVLGAGTRCRCGFLVPAGLRGCKGERHRGAHTESERCRVPLGSFPRGPFQQGDTTQNPRPASSPREPEAASPPATHWDRAPRRGPKGRDLYRWRLLSRPDARAHTHTHHRVQQNAV